MMTSLVNFLSLTPEGESESGRCHSIVTFIWRCRNDSCTLSMEQAGICCSSVASALPLEVRCIHVARLLTHLSSP